MPHQRALAFHGTFIHSRTPSTIEIEEDALLCVDAKGLIQFMKTGVEANNVESMLSSLAINRTDYDVHILSKTEFMIPGFVDTHNHAPQWEQRGLGRAMQILDWLNTITFKNEAKFHDIDHAKRVYSQAVHGFLKQGITTASYFASLHGPATIILAQTCLEAGQRALVGQVDSEVRRSWPETDVSSKCNMNANSPDFYIEESSEASLRATRDVIAAIDELDPTRTMIRPILTPRFAISCTADLLLGLGQIAHEDQTLPVQTHFNEARSEIDATLSLFPEFKNEVDLYSSFNLLGPRTILAHCCHMTPYEIAKLKALRCGIAHCPIANTTVGGGFMAAPIRTFLDHGIEKIGLGTDSGGGFSSSLLDAMRQAFIVSNSREMIYGERALSVDECFYLATLGGAACCGLEELVGTFQVGKEFDACRISTRDVDGLPLGVMTPVTFEDSRRVILEKFLMSGDDRNVTAVWVRGRRVK